MAMVVYGGHGRGTRAAGAVLAAVLLCGGAVGCGSSGADGKPEGKAGEKSSEQVRMAPAAAVRAAAKKSEKLTSFRYRMTGRTPEDGRIEGEAAMSTKPVAVRMTMRAVGQGADAAVEIRMVDGAMYLGGGKEAAGELNGKSWLKLDLSALGEKATSGLGGGSLSRQADKNPVDDSAFLSGADDVKRVGEETIDGVRTTHYRGTITLAQMRESLKDEDAATRKRREKSLGEYEKMGVDRLSMDMWIGQDGHTKRFRMRGEGDKGPLDMTITFSGLNEPVTVKAPPANQTMDLAELARGAEG
ncbi:DUF1396 domain-containing protein [Streptomyces sp. PSAA01]|uniref:DUF1396 domain-containing protein n=1 Tax=Streptomyces sp. PSAA01 TaxID=2912762 RepID=UPI001F46A289|nr:DUF1396 domain-containing protein [Streptomyces sp. PSAA01]MCG0286760.1 DUF1396 domain-containing protein [Streptomyces sp. PSAA01]